MIRKAKPKDPFPNPYLDPPVVTIIDDVPVIQPEQSPTQYVAGGSVLVTLIAWVAWLFGAPLDKPGILTVLAALNVVAGLFAWGHDRFGRSAVVATSLTDKQRRKVRAVRRYPR